MKNEVERNQDENKREMSIEPSGTSSLQFSAKGLITQGKPLGTWESKTKISNL